MSKETFCCEAFPVFAKKVSWMSFNDKGSFVLLMPYFADDKNYRVNFCPNCGKEIRDIQISEHTYHNL